MTTVHLRKPTASSPAKQRVRFWLRLLKLQRRIEAVLRDRLRAEFATTLPRFDVMAALNRHPDGLRMSELSSFLMVSNGNITGIVDRLVHEGSLERVPVEADRRAMTVRLTERGRTEFATMAAVHENWLADLLADLQADEVDAMIASFDRLNRSTGGRP